MVKYGKIRNGHTLLGMCDVAGNTRIYMVGLDNFYKKS